VEWAKEKLALVVKVVKRSDDVSGFVVLRGGGWWSACCAG
jgi:hypothetical protein